jgi:hypothetical protein
MSDGGIHLNLSADSPEAMRELFELCMAETNTLHYDGKLVLRPGDGAGQVYVFGERCPDCSGYGWIGTGSNTCTTCKGRKQVGPAWVQK